MQVCGLESALAEDYRNKTVNYRFILLELGV